MVFVTSLPISELHPHQVLALVNRWAKLKGYWYDRDLDALYNLKDQLIKTWVDSGSMSATKIIRRESPAIAAMKVEIASGGSNLSFLDSFNGDRWERLSPSDSFVHLDPLVDLVNDQIQVPLDSETQTALMEEYANLKAEYEISKRQYDADKVARKEARQEFQKEFQKNFKSYLPQVRKALLNLLERTRKKQAKGNIKQALHWIESESPIKEKQFAVIISLLRQKNARVRGINKIVPTSEPEPQKPLEPLKPKLYREIDVEEYVRGGYQLPNLEAAISWAKEALGKPDLGIADIDDCLVNCDLEDIVSEEALQVWREDAISIFERVLSGDLASPREIYDCLTALPLDYSDAIGMNYSRDLWGNIVHRDFSKWHQINLSLTGRWLVEFQSNIDSSVIFHVPYDRAKSVYPNLSDLPSEFSEQEKFGREISISEQKDYPIVELLKILGRNANDFPYKLENYSKFSYGCTSDIGWGDEEDYTTEFYEEDWAIAGY
jgi:hypothetical protein